MRLLYIFVLALLSLQLYAIPARVTSFKAKMADGTIETLRFFGDENMSFYLTESGYIAERGENGIFTRTDKRLEDVMNRVQKRAGIGTLENAPLPAAGSPKIPVILVNFSDMNMTVASTNDSVKSYYDLYCNGTRDGILYTGAGSSGAVRDYFAQQSDSTFLPEFAIIGPVTLSKEMAYYGKNSGGAKDVNFSEFCNEALHLAMEEETNFLSKFDNDKDGTVDMAFFIYAGLPESDIGVTEDAIWPKEMLTERTINGVKFSVSACCSELSLNNKGVGAPAGIGTMCHELSHSIGLPDTYDIGYTNLGMSYWSIMDSGNYCNNGKTPCGMTGYERDFLNWRQLEVVNRPATLRLQALEEGGTAYKVVNDASAGGNEYYVLENRQRTNWDASLTKVFGCGMLVTHVDYSKTAWISNTINVNASHQRMTFIPANNKYIGPYNASNSTHLVESMNGQLYSTDGALTDTTTPASVVYTGGFMYKDIKQVYQHENGDITLKFMPLGILDAPEGLQVDETGPQGGVVSWQPVAEATCYKLEAYEIGEDETKTLVYRQDSIFSTSQRVMFGNSHRYVEFCITAMCDTYEDSPAATLELDLTLDCVEQHHDTTVYDGIYTLGGIKMGDDPTALEGAVPGIYVVRRGGHASLYIISK